MKWNRTCTYWAIGLSAAVALALAYAGFEWQKRRKHQELHAVSARPNSIDDTVKIASFNVQAFGRSKRENTGIVGILTRIVTNFDIVAMQEFRDNTESTMPYFVGKLNSSTPDHYAGIQSPRLGKSSIKENYVIIYDKNKVRFSGRDLIYEDSAGTFERPPYMAGFQAGGFDFVLVNIHTKPDNATAEIMGLEEVVEAAERAFPGERDVIVLGDYNCGGRYFNEHITNGFRNTNLYLWVIPDGTDTTVGKGAFTYDRIVAGRQYTSEDYTGRMGVFRFDTEFSLSEEVTRQVSDHYPVWAVFYTARDKDHPLEKLAKGQ